jgi:hypothetical protein
LKGVSSGRAGEFDIFGNHPTALPSSRLRSSYSDPLSYDGTGRAENPVVRVDLRVTRGDGLSFIGVVIKIKEKIF